MRRLVFYLFGLVLVVAAVAAIFLAVRNSKGHDDQASNKTSATTKTAAAAKKACDLFTLSDAKLLLGDGAKGGENEQQVSSTDMTVSECSYTVAASSDAAAQITKSASLLLRSPKTTAGDAGNDNQFGPAQPAGAQDVSGYGDAAYWDPEHGQLNILKSNNWYILSYGPVTPADRTLDQTKQMADLLINKL